MDGLTPAMNAVRTALARPSVDAGTPSSQTDRRCEEGFGRAPAPVMLSAPRSSAADLTVEVVGVDSGNRPRRFASSVAAANKVAISPSSSRINEPGRSVGNR